MPSPWSWLETHPRRAAWLGALILVALACAVHGQTLSRGFVVAPDDDLVWLGMVRGAHFHDLPGWFTHQPEYFYRPLARISLYLDYLLWHDNPLGFRLTGLLLYILAAAALGWLVYELTRSRLAAFFAATLFEVYPGNWEVAYWISARADILAALFVLAALALLLRAHRERRIGPWLGALACAAAALFSKEMGLALPPIVAAWAVLGSPPLRRSGRHWVWAGVTMMIMLAMVVGYWTLRSHATVMGAQHVAELQHGQLHLRKAILMDGEWWWSPWVVQLYPLLRGAVPGLASLLVAPALFFAYWGSLALWAASLALAFSFSARAAALLLLFYPLALLPASMEIAVVPYRRFYYLPTAGSQAMTALVCLAALVMARQRWPRWGGVAALLYVGLLGVFAGQSAAMVAPLGTHLFGK
jgi:hypothetical protein